METREQRHAALAATSTSSPGSDLICHTLGCPHPAKHHFICRVAGCPGQRGLHGGSQQRASGRVDIRLCRHCLPIRRCPACHQRIAQADVEVATGEICTLSHASSQDNRDRDEPYVQELEPSDLASRAQQLLCLWAMGNSAALPYKRERRDRELQLSSPCWYLIFQVFEGLEPAVSNQQLCEAFVVAHALSSDTLWVRQAYEANLMTRVIGLLDQPCALEPYALEGHQKAILPADIGLDVVTLLVDDVSCSEQAVGCGVFYVIHGLFQRASAERRSSLSKMALLAVTAILVTLPSSREQCTSPKSFKLPLTRRSFLSASVPSGKHAGPRRDPPHLLLYA